MKNLELILTVRDFQWKMSFENDIILVFSIPPTLYHQKKEKKILINPNNTTCPTR